MFRSVADGLQTSFIPPGPRASFTPFPSLPLFPLYRDELFSTLRDSRFTSRLSSRVYERKLDEEIFKYAKSPKRPFPKRGFVRQTSAGAYVERRVSTFQNTECRILRLPSEPSPFGNNEFSRPYVRKKDIECEYRELPPGGFASALYIPTVPLEKVRFMREKAVSRASNMKGVRDTCNRFKWLVRANASECRLFVTLTYAENMTDTVRLGQDFKKFWQRLKYRYPRITGYLVAFEPQKRGAWHAHILLLSPSPLRIPNKRINAIWGHGFTKTQGVRSIHDLGAYLTAYLTNIKDGKGTKKGARLALYPPGFRFARASASAERVKVTRWWGGFSSFPDLSALSLLYDYENTVHLPGGLFQRRKIFCFLSSPS
ncbi:MAG: hypothetical protein MJY99_10700 [Fibrobacter sp.]|nr:hypothetical protein [Fibrobacter sp.]